MQFHNATRLDTQRLAELFERHSAPYRHDRLAVRVRYSRGADFSGTCYYNEGRIFVNLGRHVQFPYLLSTHIARARSAPGVWWREDYRLVINDAYQLVLFVYLHELYHYLVKQAKRNPKRKEAMCDRFATRVLVDYCHCRVVDTAGRPVPRGHWDIQDVRAFVAAAPRAVPARSTTTAPRDIPVTIHGERAATRPKPPGDRTLWDL
jgi:hypothetical protein